MTGGRFDPDGSSGQGARWEETDSDDFRRYGDLFVPHRTLQLRMLADLVPAEDGRFGVLELGCGEGLLSDRLLARWPHATVTGLDASPAMLRAAQARTARHAGRFRALEGRIEEIGQLWDGEAPRAIVSSLAVHHLTHQQKRELFGWAARTLAPGGGIFIADLLWPVTPAARSLAARAWDEAVERAAGEAGLPEALAVFREDGWNMYALDRPDPEDRPAPLAAQLVWLAEAGLESVDVYWLFAGHAIFGGCAPGSRR